MNIAIPIFNERVAPRCSIADYFLIVRLQHNEIILQKEIKLDETNWVNILKFLIELRIDNLVCGGINIEDKNSAKISGINIVDNVACSKEEIFEAIKNNKLISGYGFIPSSNNTFPFEEKNRINEIPADFNCLRCSSKECQIGERCPLIKNIDLFEKYEKEYKILDNIMDIYLEEERKLCRLSELIYYALEMKYHKIGIAYCTDLQEPAQILVSVLIRFFDVNPVCCKVSGNEIKDIVNDSQKNIICNPFAQVSILNELETDYNIIVGLCIGADSIFTKLSKAPVTTLFVKDKSLANNPIGALYSEYYLKEVDIYVI